MAPWLTPLRARRGAAVAALIAALLSGCGQTGPLALPDSARPIERVPPPAPPPAAEDDTRDDDER